MIRFVRGNLFDSKVQTLVNAVNCVGVMGKGIAKEFRERWPHMFKAYQAACRSGDVRIGRPFLWREGSRPILNVPTKEHWREPSRYEFVEAGLKAIRDNAREWGLTSMALPALGCGLGGLEWEKVRLLIVEYLGDLPIDIEVFEPVPTSAGRNPGSGGKLLRG